MKCPSGFPCSGHLACNQLESLPSPHFQVLQCHASPAPTMDYAGDLEPAKKGWVIWHLKTKQNKKKHYTIWSENYVFLQNLIKWFCKMPHTYCNIIYVCAKNTLKAKPKYTILWIFKQNLVLTWMWPLTESMIYNIKKSKIFELQAVMFSILCYLRTAKHNPIVNLFYNLF